MKVWNGTAGGTGRPHIPRDAHIVVAERTLLSKAVLTAMENSSR